MEKLVKGCYPLFKDLQIQQADPRSPANGSPLQGKAMIAYLKSEWVKRLHQLALVKSDYGIFDEELANKQIVILDQGQTHFMASVMLTVEKYFRTKRMLRRPQSWANKFLLSILAFQPLCAHVPVAMGAEQVVLESIGTLAGSTSYIHVHLEVPFGDVERQLDTYQDTLNSEFGNLKRIKDRMTKLDKAFNTPNNADKIEYLANEWYWIAQNHNKSILEMKEHLDQLSGVMPTLPEDHHRRLRRTYFRTTTMSGPVLCDYSQ